MYRNILAAAITGAALLSSGCVALKANKLPQVSALDMKAAQQKTKVFSRWHIDTQSSLVNDQAKAMGAAVHKKYFDDAIQASLCCVLVEGPSEADVVLDGVAHDENNPAAMIPAFITGFSMFTIPSWATATVHITADAKRGEITKRYDLSDSVTMTTWLPLLLAMPFMDLPIPAGKQVDENTYRNLVFQLRADGLL